MNKKNKKYKSIFSILAFSTAFSYPLLDEGKKDYKEGCCLNLSVTPELVENDFVFHVSYELSSKDLQQYVDAGLIVVAVTIDCDMTAYRVLHLFPQKDKTSDIKINCNDLFADVKVKCILLATQDIDKFNCPNDWNNTSVKADAKFFVKKASILGSSKEFTFTIKEEKESGDLVSSIADIVTDFNNKNLIDAAYDSNEIKIYLGKDLHDTYNKLGNLYPDNSLTCFIIPVFTEALALLREKEKFAEYSNYCWAGVLLDRIKEIYGKDLQEIDFSSCSIINAVFSNIALRSGKSILEIGQEQYED